MSTIGFDFLYFTSAKKSDDLLLTDYASSVISNTASLVKSVRKKIENVKLLLVKAAAIQVQCLHITITDCTAATIYMQQTFTYS